MFARRRICAPAGSPRTTSARPPLGNRVVLALLSSPLHVLLPGLCELRFTGRRSGRLVVLPAQYGRAADRVVICVGRSGGKRWWRNFRTAHPVEVRVHRVLSHGVGRVVDPADQDRPDAERIYRAAQPRNPVTDRDPLVVIDLIPPRPT